MLSVFAGGGVYADTSKLTNAAKQIIKVARQEVSEIEACPDCYAHGRNLPRPQPSWFIEPCHRPHPLVWAKLKGFPFWPAKAMPRVNSQGFVDVRFFGEHDRAWVSPKDLFLYSEEPPAPSPRKRKSDMDECVREITRHCRKLTLMFGQFKFAPPRVQYDPNDPMQIQLMLPNYNPLEPNNPLPNHEFSMPQKKKTPQKKRSFLKGKSQSNELTDISETNSKEDAHEKENEATAPKVQKLDTDVNDTSNSQTNLDDSRSKLNKKDQENIKSTTQEVAQNKTVKDEKSRNLRTPTSRSNAAFTSNTTENNSTSLNTSTSDKNNSQKAKNNVRSSAKNLPKTATQPVAESSDTARVQKRSLLKNIINPKLALSQMDNSKVTKYTKNSKAFKPKTRIVDKLNAEKELKTVSTSKENEKLSNSKTSKVPGISQLKNNKESSNVQKNTPEINIAQSPSTASNASVTHTIPSTSPMTDKSVLLLVMNGNAAEPAKQIASALDYQGNKDVFSATKEGHNSSKKESKARKSFPNKSHNLQNVQRPLLDAGEVIEVSLVKQEPSSTYQLLPPEAGPISARLHHDAHDLARRMGHLMEETYKAVAQDNINGENGTADSYQATIFYLRMQIEHMKWQHQQQLAELKHNAGISIFFFLRNRSIVNYH